jgi:hypothetical protein
MRNLIVTGLILVAACGGNVIVDQAPAGAGGATSSASTSTSSTSGTGGACPDGGMPIPAQLKSCTTQADCTQQLIYVDCCGRQEAIGVSASQVEAFQAFEKACNPVVPTCACDPGLTLAEDGQSVPPDAAIQVACSSGLCSTFVP